jgi:hypothetical protein
VRELKNALTCAVALLDPGTRVLEPGHLDSVLSDGPDSRRHLGQSQALVSCDLASGL